MKPLAYITAIAGVVQVILNRMENYDFDSDTKFQEFLRVVLTTASNASTQEDMVTLVENAKKFYYTKCIEANRVKDDGYSSYSFLEVLLSNPDVDISQIPGFIPPKEIPEDLYTGQLESTTSAPPEKPWMQ